MAVDRGTETMDELLASSEEDERALRPLPAGEGGAVPDALRAYVGKRLPLKVIEADQRRDRLILSEKAAAQQRRRRRKEEASSRLVEGQVLDGTVATVTTFGLFVDVGAADGLVHRSEITWDKGIEPRSEERRVG